MIALLISLSLSLSHPHARIRTRRTRSYLAEAVEFDVSALGGSRAASKSAPSFTVSVAVHRPRERWGASGDRRAAPASGAFTFDGDGDDDSGEGDDDADDVLCVANYRVDAIDLNKPRDIWTELIDPVS